MKIRSIKEEDLEELSIIYSRVYKNFDIGEKWTKSTAFNMLSHIFQKYNDLSFLIEDEDVILGAFFVGVKPWWDGNHLVDGEIFIDTKFQRRGLGGKLLKSVFIYAIDKYNVISWDSVTFRKTEHPWSWYKKIGFEENNEWKSFFGDPREIIKNLK